MTDIMIAKQNLDGRTLALCKDGKVLTSGKRGVSPMLDFIAEGTDLRGYSVADIVVGKAAAMLFVKAEIREVYAVTLSLSGKKLLENHGIPFSYGTLTEVINNRSGDGICPMETAVKDIFDIEKGYLAIAETARNLRIAH